MTKKQKLAIGLGSVLGAGVMATVIALPLTVTLMKNNKTYNIAFNGQKTVYTQNGSKEAFISGFKLSRPLDDNKIEVTSSNEIISKIDVIFSNDVEFQLKCTLNIEIEENSTHLFNLLFKVSNDKKTIKKIGFSNFAIHYSPAVVWPEITYVGDEDRSLKPSAGISNYSSYEFFRLSRQIESNETLSMTIEGTNADKFICDCSTQTIIQEETEVYQLGIYLSLKEIPTSDDPTTYDNITFKFSLNNPAVEETKEYSFSSQIFSFTYTPAWEAPEITNTFTTDESRVFTNDERGSKTSTFVTGDEHGFTLSKPLQAYEEISASTNNTNVKVTNVALDETRTKINLQFELVNVDFPYAEEYYYDFAITFKIVNNKTQESSTYQVKDATGKTITFKFKYQGFEGEKFNMLLSPIKLSEMQTDFYLEAQTTKTWDTTEGHDTLKNVSVDVVSGGDKIDVALDWNISQQPNSNGKIQFHFTCTPKVTATGYIPFSIRLKCSYYDYARQTDDNNVETASVSFTYIPYHNVTDSPEQYIMDRTISTMANWKETNPETGVVTNVTSFANGFIVGDATPDNPDDYRYKIATTWSLEQYFEGLDESNDLVFGVANNSMASGPYRYEEGGSATKQLLVSDSDSGSDSDYLLLDTSEASSWDQEPIKHNCWNQDANYGCDIYVYEIDFANYTSGQASKFSKIKPQLDKINKMVGETEPLNTFYTPDEPGLTYFVAGYTGTRTVEGALWWEERRPASYWYCDQLNSSALQYYNKETVQTWNLPALRENSPYGYADAKHASPAFLYQQKVDDAWFQYGAWRGPILLGAKLDESGKWKVGIAGICSFINMDESSSWYRYPQFDIFYENGTNLLEWAL